MDPVTVVQIIGMLALTWLGFDQLRNGYLRSEEEVYEDLLLDVQDGDGSDGRVRDNRVIVGGQRERFVLDDKLSKLGLFRAEDRRRYLRNRRLYPIIGALIGLATTVVTGVKDPVTPIISLVVSAGAFELIARRRANKRIKSFIRQVEFFLPIVMERLVMAVQAGHDIVSGVRTVIEMERKSRQTRANKRPVEPVTELLTMVYRLVAKGMRFEDAARSIARLVESPAFRHALIHLALAQKEGGELIGPLRELSDSTQLYYQETVEEEIAKLPVHATLPLLIMFAGLLISFMTGPLSSLFAALNAMGLQS